MKLLAITSLLAVFCGQISSTEIPQTKIPTSYSYTPSFTSKPYDPERNSFLKTLDVDIPVDGKGNNIKNPSWGSTGVGHQRFAKAYYVDGMSVPISKMPLARDISNGIMKMEGPIPPNKLNTTAMFTFWAQLMDHDFALTEDQEGQNVERIDIVIPKGDPFMDPTGKGDVKIKQVRSQFIKDSKPRTFPNFLPSLIDANTVYGFDQNKLKTLRQFKDGRMKVSQGDYLPFDPADPRLQLAGDRRTNENIALGSVHTLLVREHNRRAAQIKKKYTDFNDQQIFTLARQWVIAVIQKITVDDWLPLLIGPKHYRKHIGYYSGYDETVNPTITTEFTTGAYRVGHSLLIDRHPQIDEKGNITANPSLKQMFLRVDLLKGDTIDRIFRGLINVSNKQKTCQIIDDVRNFLFLKPDNRTLFVDLVSLNIQRSRDHGLITYNDMRKHLGLTQIKDFTEITADRASGQKINKVYNKHEYTNAANSNCDLWVGVICEKPVYGGIMGEVGAEIIGRQLARLRDGDRFWYENYMDWFMIRKVKQFTLGEMIRLNTGVKDAQDDVFRLPPKY